MSHYQVRIDHRTKSLSFGTDLGVSQKEDIPEGPYIQSMPSEQIRNQVINIAQALNQAMEIIGPKESTLVRNRTFIIFFINNFFFISFHNKREKYSNAKLAVPPQNHLRQIDT